MLARVAGIDLICSSSSSRCCLQSGGRAGGRALNETSTPERRRTAPWRMRSRGERSSRSDIASFRRGVPLSAPGCVAGRLVRACRLSELFFFAVVTIAEK